MERGTQGFVIRGEKVSLRKITLEDTDLIVKWRNNERVRNMVYNCNLIDISGLFYKKAGVMLEHLKEFAKAIADECDNIEYGHTDIDFDARKDTNMLFITFLHFDPDRANTKTMRFNYVQGDYMMPIKVSSDSMIS